MNVTSVLTFVVQLLDVLPSLLQAGVQVQHILRTSSEMVHRMQAENRDPTPEEWKAMEDMIAILREQLRSPSVPLPLNPAELVVSSGDHTGKDALSGNKTNR